MKYESRTFDQRVPLSPWKKLNPLWLFQNADEPNPPDWYRFQEPSFTLIKWYLRNPFQNGGKYGFGYALIWPALIWLGLWIAFDISAWWLLLLIFCIGGVEDRNFIVEGMAPIEAIVWSDAGQEHSGFAAFKFSVIWLGGFMPLPFISLENKWVIFYFGWQYMGFFGIKANLRFGPQVV